MMSDKNIIQNTNSPNGSNIPDYAFKFPLENSFGKVEIPFAFQNNIDETTGNRFSSYITIRGTPTLFLDVSNDINANKIILSSDIDTLKGSVKHLEETRNNLEAKISSSKAENDSLKNEINIITNDIQLKKNHIQNAKARIIDNDSIHKKRLKDLSNKLNEKILIHKTLHDKYLKLENEINNTTNQGNNNQNESSEKCSASTTSVEQEKVYDIIKEPNLHLNVDYLNSNEYLARKFSCLSYNESYIKESLQVDLLDFQAHVKEQIKEVKPKLNQLIELIQMSTNEAIGVDYEVKLYGSHATNLCLLWSDLDVVIIHKYNKPISSYVTLHDLYKYMQEKNYFKEIKYISTANVPLIKLCTNDNFNNMSVDISLQDAKHYGIKCVSYVSNLLNEYESLMPMVLASKNILKQADLNDPYKGGLSSYGLILLTVYFLIEQQKMKKPITISHGNLGRLFYEFLYFYGNRFDPRNNIVSLTDDYDLKRMMDSNYMFQTELIILDPLNHDNNVAKNTHPYSNIKLAFMHAYYTSFEQCECGCHFQSSSSTSAQDVEHCILKRIFNGVKKYPTHFNN